MITPNPWFERTFNLDLPVTAFPHIVERLRGTPARLEDRLRPHAPGLLTRRDGDGWSIQENVGQDLEPLWACRLDAFLAGAQELLPADLANRKTHDADHNARPVQDLLAAFRTARMLMVSRLDGLDAAEIERTALHPRLRQPMRLLDHAFFVAEHDDHHLTRITRLLARP